MTNTEEYIHRILDKNTTDIENIDQRLHLVEASTQVTNERISFLISAVDQLKNKFEEVVIQIAGIEGKFYKIFLVVLPIVMGVIAVLWEFKSKIL